MTTIGEFLYKTKHLVKKADEATNPPSSNDAKETYVNNNSNWVIPILNWGMDTVNYFAPGTGNKFVADYAHKTQPKTIYTGDDVPQFGPERYVALADKIFGDGNPDNNPYLNYFRGVDDKFTDADFMYQLHAIMKSNPKVSAMIMRNVMKGDRTFADMLTNEARLASTRDPEGARNAARGAQYLYNQLGTLGKSFAGPEVQGKIMGEQFTGEFDRQRKLYYDGRYGQLNQWGAPYLFERWDDETNRANFQQYADDYNKKIFNPLIADKRLEHNFYGKLQDPGVRNAVRYATPWLAYGVPLAAGASAFGNDSLWGPVGLGLLGGGAYGYASGNGYVPQIKWLDSAVGTVNKPVAWGIGKVLPEGFPMEQALVDPVTPPVKNNTQQNQQQSSQPNTDPNQTYPPTAQNNPYNFKTNTWTPYKIS